MMDLVWVISGSIICIFVLSILYWKYLNLRLSSRLLSLSLGLPLLFIVFEFSIIIAKNFTFSIIISSIIVLVSILTAFRCLPGGVKILSKIGEIDNIPIYLCETKHEYSNAWYNHKKKAIYVTKRLRKILTEEELKAVLEHEIGHQRTPWINSLLSYLAIFSSLLVFSLIILVYLFALMFPKFMSGYIELLMIFIFVAVCSSLILWVEEHEADRNAIKKYKDVEKFATSLIKIEMDSYVRKFSPLIDVKIEQVLQFNFENKRYTYINFLRDFLYYFFSYVVLSVSDIFHRDIFLTHPPTKFRILYLTNFLKENEK